MKIIVRRGAGVFLLLLVLAAGLDRCSLWLWEWRVHRFFNALHHEASASWKQRDAMWARGEWYRLNVSAARPSGSARSLYPVDYTEVVLDRPGGIKPSDVIVDGLGGLHLRYFPPATVWSIPVRHLFSGSEDPLWSARCRQSYSIDIQWYGETATSPRPAHALVRLVHGVQAI